MDEPKGVIFDMDGVLIDSFDAHFQSWRQVAAAHGREYTRVDFIAGFGRTSREVIAQQWKEESLDELRIRDLADSKEAAFREIIHEEFPAMEGARELIESLAQAGFRIAVGSSGPRDNVELVIQRLGIGPRLSAVITGDDVVRGKPDPQVFQLAAARIDVAASRCIVVEDAPVGVEAARRGGMHAIALASTGRTVDELLAADLVVKSLRDLGVRQFDSLLEKRSPSGDIS